jgi:hypothetical protein
MKLSAFAFLFLSTVAISSAHADTDALGGHWRGTFDSPVGQTMIEIQFDKDAGVYRGHYWNTGTSFPVNELGPGQSIRFVVPNVGVFQGRLHGEILEGTFLNAGTTGPFRLDRAPEPDFGFVD